ncbi:UDP-N-acetylmuramate--L-alanine ligase [Mucilaginibacter sp. Bleaf8]|uniref:UDP-N-acetylmuramate--L-alanine ligase n=1 Tax=Mucilaginibacter sp. Bleaf8 TaxID=2834430 RepID=UPI001BCFA49D|nr:UDP-N-acetylmuramate--L-alanine ligase [Mucilaginibacter sp. Bleaf8]MBS7566301.1 UDP-N-acetylmuramate--L-alanine ligase [Mucilaginibacter sp. Bleaf8]
MELQKIQHVYLIGIGGIGMSGLARYFHHLGCIVCGYDKTPTPLTDALQAEGISVIFSDTPDFIPTAFSKPGDNVLVIYTPAVPKNLRILNYFQDNGFELYKRSQVLGIISKGKFTVAVAGTHGKTTTSSMIAHILKQSGKDCSAFLGGLTVNYKSNVLYGKSDIVVVEADEYDRSFLTLFPDVAIVTSMDADHLDIYGDHEHLNESFRMFASQVKENGRLIVKKGLPLASPLSTSYSIKGEHADAVAENIKIVRGDFYFDFLSRDTVIGNIKMGIPGTHNVENATAAVQAALYMGVSPAQVKAALASFKGVKRRFEYVIKTGQHIFIDDYAHHPEELKACLSSVKKLYPHRKLTTVFQPHLYTRTRDFADGFAEALDLSDELLMLDIYPARELPIDGVNSEMILDRMKLKNKRMCGSMQDVIDRVHKEKPELLLTVGAGDIDQIIEPLKSALGYVE